MTRRGAWALAVIIAVGLGVWSERRVAAQAEPRIWQGVFTEAQAQRGRAMFTSVCLRCHGGDLAGTTAPALKGDRFHTTFGQEPIDRLFLKVRDTMPPNFGTVIDDQTKLDIVTYILQANGYPAGASELKLASEDLATAQILKKGEQAAVQNFSLVRAVGCLSPGAAGGWALTRATDPLTTRDDAVSSQSLATSAARALGTRQFTLLSAAPFKPQDYVGRKVEARGLVYIDGPQSKLTVTSLAVAAETCS
jgi:mono/diheme cytochrome c family protein